MREKAEQKTGEAGFDFFYAEYFGERWKNLRESFLKKTDCVEFKAGGEKSYFLDSASVLCACSLPLVGAKKILDVCAAPGGKSVVLASRMESDAALISNERSEARKKRLTSSILQCLPKNVSERVFVWGRDGAKLCLDKKNIESFDRILLDAPCSSERHVFCDKKYLEKWSPSRIRALASEQWALLSCAWRLLKFDGFLLYSTCALCAQENDEQISRLCRKFGSEVEVVKNPPISSVSDFCFEKFPIGEKPDFGTNVLPDSTNGAGPLYFSLVHKVQKI